ncbi:pyruvate dehydrogenase (quinone)/pyruvate oxidase [Tumebacillus sp. BK434]|uniref:thiamine pyrophosphate-binding protein n=1 Tax=Tumebacillus sp. BK434 TaxID=2512169 RepID=UPI0010E1CE87|nr:thiamine pyrophosphate-binding protein [Tumebacillus sp. BK434]TCP52400.1 pyruvate dehydrogenase (quinone)/pyruvate oxidase [Tumebacillus sp. BK434]
MIPGTEQQSLQAATLPTMQIMTVADTFVKQLEAWGVQRIYGVVGDTFLDFLDAVQRSSIRFVAVKHEGTAAFMASAEAKLTGRLGVCIATSGPGMANLMNGLGDADQDRVPVLAITGQVPTKKIGTDTKQYLDQQVFIEPLAAYSALLAAPDATVELLTKAIHTALELGAVTHLSVPKDLWAMLQTNAVRKRPQMVKGVLEFNPQDVGQAAAIMKTAKQPVVVAGLGAREAAADVVRLCETWGAGLILSLGAKGMIDENCPQLLGGIGKGGSPQASQLLKKADVVLLAGDSWWPEGYVPESARLIQIDYAAANIGTRFHVELGLVGATGQVLPELVKRLAGQEKNEQWLTYIGRQRAKWQAQVEQEATTEGTPVHPARLVRALQNTVAKDAVLCVDTGDHTVWFNRIFAGSGEQQTLFSGTWRSMGFGLPAAMACQLIEPERQVVALVGDGCLGMTLADLSTAVRYNLPITVVVVNNGNLQMETDRQIVGQHTTLGSDLTNPDFVKVAEACGLAGFRVTDSAELDKTLEQALALPGPVLVDVATLPLTFPNTSPQEG